jgi:hypothetical protein
VLPKACEIETIIRSNEPFDQALNQLEASIHRHGYCIIVGLNVALKGPFPLVGESEVSRTTPKLLYDHRH